MQPRTVSSFPFVQGTRNTEKSGTDEDAYPTPTEMCSSKCLPDVTSLVHLYFFRFPKRRFQSFVDKTDDLSFAEFCLTRNCEVQFANKCPSGTDIARHGRNESGSQLDERIIIFRLPE